MFPLPKMRRAAKRICEVLAPHCETTPVSLDNIGTLFGGFDEDGKPAAPGTLLPMLAIAGSIRRECPLPGDIDLVCLPRPGAAPALRTAFLALAEGPFGKVETDGPDAKRILGGRSGIQCDLWIARQPETGLFDSRPVAVLAQRWLEAHRLEQDSYGHANGNANEAVPGLRGRRAGGNRLLSPEGRHAADAVPGMPQPEVPGEGEGESGLPGEADGGEAGMGEPESETEAPA